MLFLPAGAVTGGWAARIPTVKDQLGLGDGEWGLVILAVPIGTRITLGVQTRVITRTGARVLAVPGAVVLATRVVLPAAAQPGRDASG